jgi:hypothetical protein
MIIKEAKKLVSNLIGRSVTFKNLCKKLGIAHNIEGIVAYKMDAYCLGKIFLNDGINHLTKI